MPRRLRNFLDRFPQTSCETSTRDEGVLVLRSSRVDVFGAMGSVVSPYDPPLETMLRWRILAPWSPEWVPTRWCGAVEPSAGLNFAARVRAEDVELDSRSSGRSINKTIVFNSQLIRKSQK